MHGRHFSRGRIRIGLPARAAGAAITAILSGVLAGGVARAAEAGPEPERAARCERGNRCEQEDQPGQAVQGGQAVRRGQAARARQLSEEEQSAAEASAAAPDVAQRDAPPPGAPAAGTSSAGATSTSGLPHAQLDPIVVTATRTRERLSTTPQTVTVITSEDLEVREDATVGDVLRQAVGVEVVQAGTLGAQTSVFIRGSDADQVLTLIDGVQVNSATVGAFDFANLTPEGFERIEILRGGGGSLYGSEAVGGVINFITQKGFAPWTASISGAGGNGQTDRETTSFAWADDRFSAAGAATHIGTAGFGPAVPLDASGSETKHNDAYDATTVSLRGDYRPTETGSLYAIGHYIRSHVGLLNASNFLGILDPNAHQSQDFYFAKLGWEDAPLPGLSYHLDAAYVRDDYRYDDPSDLANPAETRSSIPTETVQADAQANYAFGTWSISTLGFQYTRRAADVSSFYSFGVPPETRFDVSRNDYGVYAQEQVRLFDEALVLIGSVRHDHDTQFGDVTVPAASIAWRFRRLGSLPAGLRLRASYAEGFRAPSFNELYFPNFGNPDLGPERSSEWDAGADLELLDGRATIAVTYFNRRVKDDIVTVLVDPETFEFRPENVGRVDGTGVEVSPQADLGYGLSLGGAYTYLGLESHAGSGPVLRRPNNQMAAFAMWQTPRLVAADDAFRARVDVFFVGDRPDANPETGQIGTNPQYTRVDLALAWQLPWRVEGIALQAFANISNLLDRSYEEVLGFPARPINALAGLRATF